MNVLRPRRRYWLSNATGLLLPLLLVVSHDSFHRHGDDFAWWIVLVLTVVLVPWMGVLAFLYFLFWREGWIGKATGPWRKEAPLGEITAVRRRYPKSGYASMVRMTEIQFVRSDGSEALRFDGRAFSNKQVGQLAGQLGLRFESDPDATGE